MLFLKTLCCLLLFAGVSFAHPGHDVTEEAAERAEFLRQNPRTVRSCASKFKARGHEDAGVQRRQAVYESLLKKRNPPPKPLTIREFALYNFSHFSSDAAINNTTSPAVLFGDDSSCILQPDVTQGPYYVNGELIRENVVEDQGGIPLFLQMQFIDTSTCEPIPDMWVDLWHCNATGVYSGVVATGNGNSNDTSNSDATFLRGINRTNSAGVAHFQTIFPGHYSGRTTHIHLLTHAGHTTVNMNKTLEVADTTTVQASHVGQIFFDQVLIDFFDQAYPYTENTAKLTLNEDDGILGKEADMTDPFPEYVWLSDNIYDGTFAWISIGIDFCQSNDVSAAAMLYESGGVENEQGGMGGAAPADESSGEQPPSGSVAAPSGSAAATVSSGSAVSTFFTSGANKGR